MKTQSATAHTLMTAKPHQVTRLFVGQASGQPHSPMGKVPLALSEQDCAIAKPVPGWYQRLKQNFLRFKTRPAHIHALADDSPSTFEPFAELFLLVVNDNAIHPTLRIWYSRLQWPVIQMATADPIGFQVDSHPARRLIVSLGEYALGQGAVELPCGSLEQELKRLVLSIEDASVPSQSVFEQACKEFDEFLILSQTQPPVVNCSTCLQGQQQALTTQYQKAILNKLMSMPVQNATREFLTQVWAEILAAHAVRKGLQHPDTLTLKQVAFELIQVSTDLAILGERRRAMAQVPQLVQQLRRGMVWMEIAPAAQNQHIQDVGGNLSDAFTARQGPSAPVWSDHERTGHQPVSPPSIVPKINRTVVDGLLVSDENTDFDWYLWECALTEQASGQTAPKQGLTDIFATPSFADTTIDSPDFWGAYAGDSL